MKVALAQVNPTMGDFEGNMRKIETFIERAQNADADLVAFPEMVISGYPPQDLLYERSFVRANKTAVVELAKKTGDMLIVLGFVDFDDDWRLFNAAAVLGHHRQLSVVHKTLLPTYDVFDEARYFRPNDPQQIRPVNAELKGRPTRIGIEICEDLWDRDYDTKVTDLLVQRGAEFVINISSSPFYVGKRFEREELLREKATANGIPMLMVNLVGGQDELVFDGQSMVVDASGETVRMGQQFEEDLVLVDLEIGTAIDKESNYPSYDKDEEVFSALVLGIRDYFRKTGFEKAVLGISGGIDSAVTAGVAVEALGAKNVLAFSMPSKFSSGQGRTDAEEIARNLGISMVKFSIQEIVDSYRKTLDRPLGEVRALFGLDKSKDDLVADENLQPRARGN
ncbi:MAG: NAD+ synthase, partial [Candidatus Thorarchaeota archaeon]